MENARKAKKEKGELKKSKKLTSEQQMEEDLKQILRVESISKNYLVMLTLYLILKIHYLK
jgi:hypothetical protein